ncbi:MAG TPA: sigma-70 family RNA polymerase sigma factor [Rhizobiaceae bacterium]|nr:sigma-70 family RNA polymerase sigma factor [Rhizobiaceae bacterium]
MPEILHLTERFQASRPRLRSLAYRILGNLADCEDVLQDAWLRICRAQESGVPEIANVEGWLTTIVARTCLNRLRSRRVRPEELCGISLPDFFITDIKESGPEQEILLAEQVGLALQIVLDTLSPPERIAFVLRDLFGMPFNEIAAVLQQSPEAARQLASRGRRRIKGADTDNANPDTGAGRQVVDAFFAASRDGNLDALLAVLHPDVIFRADGGATRPNATATIRGQKQVARRAATFSIPGAATRPVLVNGLPGVIARTEHGPVSIMAFTVAEARITEIYALLDVDRIRRLLEGEPLRSPMH